MNPEDNKPAEDTKPAETPTNETPAPDQTPQAQPEHHSSNKTVGILVGIIVLLLAVLAGVGLYAMTKDNSNGNSGNRTSENRDDGSSAATIDESEDKPLKEGIQTEYQAFEANLESMTASNNSVSVNFSLVCVRPDKGQDDSECFTGDIWTVRTNNNILSTAYLLDDAAQQKYEVVKDANGKPLASTVGPSQQYVKKGKKVNYNITLTKPPKDSQVTLYIPKVQPISGLTITK